jgi:hypothetical protein
MVEVFSYFQDWGFFHGFSGLSWCPVVKLLGKFCYAVDGLDAHAGDDTRSGSVRGCL